MPKFLLEANYTAEGLAGAIKETFASREQAISKALSSAGGKLECAYFGFGGTEVVCLMDLPDASSAATLSWAVSSSGRVIVKKVEQLLTAEEADKAAKRSPSYRAPGAKKK